MDLVAIDSPGAAFLAGLVTSLHCAGMCGPLACSLLAVRKNSREPARMVDVQTVSTVYHVSRLMAYAALGAAGGALGAAPLAWISRSALRWLPWLFVVFFVGFALRWDRYLPKIPAVGRWIWHVRSRMGTRSEVAGAAALGGLTPLLPCGPLYFVVSLTLMTGSALRGVEFMLAFGLGTIPLLWLAQTQFHWVRQKLSPLWLDRTRLTLSVAAAAIIAWRLRATLGLPGPDPSTFVCH